MDTSTILAADRIAHAKIVAISCAASVAILFVGAMARSAVDNMGTRVQVAGPAVKAAKPVAVSHSDLTAIR